MSLGVDARDADGVLVVGFTDPLDLTAAHAASVRALLEESARQGRPVVLDLHAVGFIDSGGVGVLVAAARACRRHGGELVLARPAEDVSTVLDLLRMHRLMAIHDDVETAIEAAREAV